jgi:hypothetical protein
MKLGSQTGSLINHMYSRGVIGQPTPVVGMGCTELLWTDRHAGTIVEVVEDKGAVQRIGITQDKAIVVKGSSFDGSAEYEYETRIDAGVSYYRIGKNGFWQQCRLNERNRWVSTGSGGRGLRIGAREEYRDPSF